MLIDDTPSVEANAQRNRVLISFLVEAAGQEAAM